MDIVRKTDEPVEVTEKPIDEQVSPQQSTQDEKLSFVDKWYIWEVGGVLISAAAIMTIIALLLWLDGKEIPDWGYTTPATRVSAPKTISISFNSVLSWISVVGKIAILIPITKGLAQLKWVWFMQQERRLDDLEKFDSATRGLSGSARLLWRLKGRHLAAIGAIATILSLGFGPFIQNLVTYETTFVPYQEPQDGGFDDFFTNPHHIYVATQFDGATDSGNLDLGSRTAILNGLLRPTPPTFREPTLYCTSGNCTWKSYDTLGVGVHCADITSRLTKNCVGTAVNATLGPACDYSLPNGVRLGLDGQTVFHVSMNSTPLVYSNYTEPIALAHTIGDLSTGASYIGNESSVTAAECVLFPAVKTFTTSMGQYYFKDWENIVGRIGPSNYYTETMQNLYETYESTGGDDNSTEAAYVFRPQPPLTKPRSLENDIEDNTYTISARTVQAFQKHLRELLQGSVRSELATDFLSFVAEANPGQSSDALEAIYTGLCHGIPQFFEWNDVEGVGTNLAPNAAVYCAMESISAALTATMRNDQFIVRSLVRGEMIVQVVLVRVTWWWIALPVVVWICSVIMLVGTAVKTKRANVYLWKENPLAMVFLRLGRDERAEVNHIGGLTQDGLIKRAENIRVQLHVEGGENIILRKPNASAAEVD